MALVTGGAQRIGRAIALALASAGHDIGLHYGTSRVAAEQTAEDIRRLGRRVFVLQADLRDEQATAGLIPELGRNLGAPVVLINCASHFRYDDIRSVGYASLLDHLMPNLAAPLLLARTFAEELARAPRDSVRTSRLENAVATEVMRNEARQGVIVNLLDQKLLNLNPDFLSYTVSKAALQCATTVLAQALAPQVRVVGVAPGLTLPSYLQDDEQFQHAHAETSPLGRSSTIEDVVDAVLFSVRNRSVTGSMITVDGGQHLSGLRRDVSLLGSATGGPDGGSAVPGRNGACESPPGRSRNAGPAEGSDAEVARKDDRDRDEGQ